MNAVYAEYFQKPFPNRATIVAQLMVPGARIEIVAYAHVGRKAVRTSRQTLTSPKKTIRKPAPKARGKKK